MNKYRFFLIIALTGLVTAMGQNSKSKESISHPPCNEFAIPRYIAQKIKSPITLDGKPDEEIWQKAKKSRNFVDLIYDTETIHETKAAVVWDDEYLYVAYWVTEPDVTATLTERDSPIYKNNDVELFVAGKDAYYEFEINSFGTIYEVFFVWEDAYLSQGYDKVPNLGPNAEKKRDFRGVGYRHPRGNRYGFWNWDLEGLKTAVHVDGTINKSDDRDRGWTVELALPWSSLDILTRNSDKTTPPKNGDEWRMDFSRFNQYKEAEPAKDSGGWAWSSHRVWDSHVPECFTFIQFSDTYVEAP